MANSGVERFKRSQSFKYVGADGRVQDGMWQTTYKDHLDKFLTNKVGPQNLEIYDIHRGKHPPKKTPKVRWDKHRSAWVRADNLQYNFVKDTWKPHFKYDHPGCTGSEARFQSSNKIGGDLRGHDGVLATALGNWGQRVVAEEDDRPSPKVPAGGRPIRTGPAGAEAGDDPPSPVRAARTGVLGSARSTTFRSTMSARTSREMSPRHRKVPPELYESLPDADLLARNMGSEASLQQPHEWAGIKTEKMFLSANPNLYGRWYRTASNVQFNAEPGDRFVTSKMVENEQANKLYLDRQKWKKGYNFAKFHKNKPTAVSQECPQWMQVPGVRLNNVDPRHQTKMAKYVEATRRTIGQQAATVASGSVIRAQHDQETPHFDNRFRFSSRKLRTESASPRRGKSPSKYTAETAREARR